MKRIYYITLLLFALCIISCQKEPEPIRVTAVTLNTESLFLTEGETATIVATVSPSNADNQKVLWTSSNASVASVNNGLVTAMKEGSATITASSDDGGKKATCLVEVNAKYIPVESVSLDKAELELTEGEGYEFVADVLPHTATNKAVTWSSSNPDVVAVTDGRAVSIKAGAATVTVKTEDGGKTAECRVTVKEKPVPVESITVSEDFLLLKMGSSQQLTIEFHPENATDKKVRWESSNPIVATVSDGMVKIEDVGYAVITAISEDGAQKDSCEILTYSKDPVDLGLSVKWSSLNIDAQTPLQYGGYYAWGEVKEKSSYSWGNYMYCNGTENYMTKYCSEPQYGDADYKSVLEKDDDVSWVKLGDGWRTPTERECDELLENTNMVVKTFGGVVGELHIAKNGRSIFFPKANNPHSVYYYWTTEYAWYLTSTLCLGESSEYCSILTLGGTTGSISYTGGAERASGYSVRPIYGGDPVMPVLGIKLSKSKISLSSGQSETLSVEFMPENATSRKVQWKSSDEGIASVSNGKVTAHKEGTAVITATTEDGGKTASCDVTVATGPLEDLSITFHNQSGTYGHSIYIGKDYYYTASLKPSNPDADLEWSIENPQIATLSPASDTYCSFHTTGFGRTKITLRDKKSGLSASDEIETCVTGFKFTEDTGVTSYGYPKITLAVGDSYQLHWTCSPYISEGLFYNLAALKMKEVTSGVYVMVDEPSVVSIDANGVVTGVKAGTIIISPMNNYGIYRSGDSGVFIEVVKGYSETEPNNDFPYANEIRDGKTMDFSLASTSDVDTFWFKNPATSYGPQNVTIDLKYKGEASATSSRAIRWECYNGSFSLLGSGTVVISSNGYQFTTNTFLNTDKGYLKFYYPDNWKNTPEGLPRGTFAVSVKNKE